MTYPPPPPSTSGGPAWQPPAVDGPRGLAPGATGEPHWQAPTGGPHWQAPPPSGGAAWQPPGPSRHRWPLALVLVAGMIVLLVAATFAARPLLEGALEGFEGFAEYGEWVVPVGPDSDLTGLDVEVGTCATTDDLWWPTVISPVDCERRHDLEVYLVTNLDVAPGLSVPDAALDVCEPAFSAFVGAAYSRSEYDYVAFVPDDARFAAGERAVVCAVRPWEGDLVGTVAGTRR
ncbi:hypothetical protein [Egicoccus sp. AB-alg2]|uniref:hypothetical protein n=1 Tax=Egicoccus sp. AB-alg2 TaxID=3242693 RepID=UPI00359D906E